MRIVHQSARVSHCSFPLLPAPRIAGLLAAPAVERPPEVPSFAYRNPRLGELPADLVDRLLSATRTLLDVAVAHGSGEMTDHALNTALALFRRAVTGQTMRPTTPAQFNAELDAPLLDWAMTIARRDTQPEVRHE